jgi:MOSC domain-containing protein YiiM
MTIEHIFISTAHNFVGHHGKPPGETPITEVDQIECVAGRGLRGDRYFDHKPGYKGQATFFSVETLERVCEQIQAQDCELPAVRRNIFVKEVNLNDLIGKVFQIQGVSFEGTEECRPCYWMDHAIGHGAENAMRGFGGLRVKILSDGILRRGPADLKVLEMDLESAP